MNEYFQTGAVPAPSSPGASSVMRQEFANIAAGFDKLPVLAGHANEILFVDPTGSRLETNGTVLTDFVTLAGTQELINKTIPWADNTFLGFNDAATKVAGTGAGQVLLLAEANKLPVLDGSLLTNLNQGSLSTVSIAKGGTGATDLTGAQVNLGINLKADANNTVLTGAPTAPTPLTGDASARIATTYFVADTMQAIGAFGPSSMNPLMNGIVSPGVAILGSRSDHVHPTDTSRAPVASPTFTGVPAAPTAAADTNTTQLATTAFMIGQAGASSPVMDGVAAVGTSVKFARQDHVHPTNTSRAPINSPTFTGTPAAPTPLTSDNTTKVATTAFVQSLLAQQPPAGMQPSNSTPLMDGTAAAGTGVEGSRYDHVHPSDTSKLSLSGGTLTGQLKGITPAAVDDLTRKDYVDTKLALAGGTLTGNLVVPSLNGGPLAGFRNRLINGDMRIAQRPAHTPLLATIDFLADRWFSWSEGAANASITLVATPTGGVDGNRNYLSIMGAAGNTYSSIWQRIEAVNCADLKNKVITVSAEVYTQDARAVSFDLRYPNARDNWSAMTTIGTWSSPVASGWRRIQTQFTVPNNTFGLSVGVSFGALGAGVEALITAVQIEEGAVATPFEQRLISVEMQLCFRYYWRIQANSTYSRIIATGTTNGNGTGGYFVFRTPVKMRGICAVTMSIIGNFHIGSGASSFNATSFTLDSTSLNNPELDSFVLHVLHAGAAFLVGGACMLLTLGSQSSNHIGFNSELL